MDESSARRSGSNLVLGVILVGLGLFFLVTQFTGFYAARWLWPFFVIVPGLSFLVAMAIGGRSWGWAAIPGSIITTVGLILLYQNLTNHFQSWSYAWALIPAAVGVGLIINGTMNDLPEMVRRGRRLVGTGLVLFLIFGAFFEVIINIGGMIFFSPFVWPLLLIAAGLYLVLRRGSNL